MSVGILSPQQVRSIVEDKWQRDLEALAVGLHIAPSVIGPQEVEFEFGKAKVVRADTVFEVREALLAAEKDNQRVVLLTGLQQNDLGHDVVGRLARSRLFTVDHWASLCALFKAKELDRSICEPAIAQALLEYAPPDGYPPVSAGLLDAGTVWRAICRNVFDISESEPDLVTLLLWASSERSARYLVVADEVRASLKRRLRSNLGDAAISILNFIEHGAGPDSLALAVVCQVVFGSGSTETLTAAAARMEKVHGLPIPDAVGRLLGEQAISAIADLDRFDDQRFAQVHLQRADELLKEFLCEEYAYRNTLTRESFEQRLSRLGAAIEAALPNLTDEAIAMCESQLESVAQHRFAKLGPNKSQVSKAEMAVRLVRWLKTASGDQSSLVEQANYHIRELSFVDWAREPLCRGDNSPELSAAYQLLDQTVLARREAISRGFAQTLADWSLVGSKAAGVMGVEDILSQVVSQVVAAGNRVLLLVLDGMSWAVCHELLEDIRQDHWFESTLDPNSMPPAPVMATVPSVTTFSRTSLLSGYLAKGDQNSEKKNFEANKSLLEVCDKKHLPQVFHKQQVTDGNRGAIGQELSNKFLSKQHKVVAAVINAIDDRLANAQQIVEHWALSRINPLGALLRLARDTERVVILASDHGHVWHRPDGEYRAHDEGSRWRSNDGQVADDEIIVRGQRVMTGDQTVIVPWTERVYYSRQQNGYHGGATPQEMVCPLIILTDKASAHSGLFPCAYPKPEWWLAKPVPTMTIPEPLPIAAPPKFGPLFDGVTQAEAPILVEQPKSTRTTSSSDASWIESLFDSPPYRNQKSLIRRHPIDDKVLKACLEALDNSGGIMTPAAFAKTAQISVARLDGLIVNIQRVLNMDGYDILTMDRAENRIELNVSKLKRQFGLE